MTGTPPSGDGALPAGAVTLARPAESEDRMTGESYVLLERTKTRGYRVAWVSPQGGKVIRHRGIVDYEIALRQAARLAVLHDCHLEAAP